MNRASGFQHNVGICISEKSTHFATAPAPQCNDGSSSHGVVLVLRKRVDIGFSYLFFYTIAELVSLFLNVFVFCIIIQVIISWVNPGAQNPALALVNALAEPVLRPARRIIRPIGGIDLSPLAVLLVLQLIKMLVIPPIKELGKIFGA